MQVEQYVMAYEVEQDRLRALLPVGFVSLRPVLRINGEIRRGPKETAYLELNTPVEGHGKRGWLNVGHWDSRTAVSYTHLTASPPRRWRRSRPWAKPCLGISSPWIPPPRCCLLYTSRCV